MGTPIELPGGTLDPERPPDKLELLKRIRPATRVPLEELREIGAGRVFDELEVRVGAPLPGVEARLQLVPEGIPEELRQVLEAPPAGEGFSHRLVCRRLRHVSNSVGRHFPESRAKGVTNPAYLNPTDCEALGLAPGDLVEIASDQDRILGVVEPSDEVGPGVVSMAHCWGGAPDEDGRVREIGANTGRLVATDRDYDPITGMARQSAIPVNLRPARR
jgi:anaerobic selenocysteine-containing dehydrogenase